jgi:hypothetical protein
MNTLRTLGFFTLFLAFGLAACADADRDLDAAPDADDDLEVMEEDVSSDDMRDEIMEEQLEEVSVLQREMTGNWRAEAREMMLDFEGRRYEGFTPAGEPLEGDLRIVEEGDDYVVFMVGDETLTARTVGDGQILLSTSPDDADGLRFRR